MFVLLLVTGYGLSAAPLLVIGAVLGAALVGATVGWPLGVLAVMLALGPVDLSFLTGGARGLLPQLGGVDMSGIRLVGITAGLGLVVLTRRDLLKSLLGPTARWYVLFLVWAAASLPLSPDPLEGLRLLLKLTYPLLVFLVVAAPDRTEAQVRRLGDWALWGAALIVVVNPIFVLNGGFTVERGELLRVTGPGAHANPFSFYLLAILLLCAGRYRGRRQTRYLLLGGMAMVWMSLTLTRITFLAALVGFGVAALYAALAERSVKGILVMGTLAAGVVGLLLTGVLDRTFGYIPTPGQLLSLIIHPGALYAAINWQGRELLWAVVGSVFMTDPWFGSGLGASAVALLATTNQTVPHNEYLRLAADLGLVGCALYALAILAWVRAVVHAVRHTDRGRGEELAMPALAAFAAWGVIALTDNAFDYYGPLTQYVAFLTAGCVVLGRAAAVERSATPPPEPATAGLCPAEAAAPTG